MFFIGGILRIGIFFFLPFLDHMQRIYTRKKVYLLVFGGAEMVKWMTESTLEKEASIFCAKQLKLPIGIEKLFQKYEPAAFTMWIKHV